MTGLPTIVPPAAKAARSARWERFLRCSLLGLAVSAVLGCNVSLPGRPKPGPEVPTPDSIVDFNTLYSQNCSACHGAKGMNGPSYPLANPVYQALVSEQQLHQVVANGVPGSLMPAFAGSAGGSLTDQQVDALVKGMRAAWYKPAALGGANPPPYKAAKAGEPAHGQQVYTAYCASCHGRAGQTGSSKAGSITEPAFLALISSQALRTIIIAGRPDLGQPDWRHYQQGGQPGQSQDHAMTDQEVTDVVAWLAARQPGPPAAPKENGGSSQ